MGAPGWAVLLAVAPVAALAVMVLWGRPLTGSALTATALAAVLAMTAFGLDLRGLAIGAARGAWTGGWILLVVLPALLLFEVLQRAGALDRLADAAAELAPTPGRQRLLLGWVLPSFLQGAAGFGTPVAIVAPMLVRVGMTPLAALSTSLIGYQWAVTFGSMGSSYFTAVGTARLTDAAAGSFALRAGVVLAISCTVSGLLVLGRDRASRRDLPVALVLGAVMGTTLVAVVTTQPALGSVVAGLAGLVAAYLVLPSGPRPGGRDLALAALPYIVLTVAVVTAYALPPIRALLDRAPVFAPVMPSTRAAFGHVNAASAVAPSLAPTLHPAGFLLAAAAFGVVLYRVVGWWPTGTTRATVVAWGGRVGKVSVSIVAVTVLASLLTEAGMVAAVAVFLADSLDLAFVAVSPLLGTFGTVLTGSTTASNALFAPLQAEVAQRLDLAIPALLSGQTAGGNVGNALSPVNIAVGAAVVGVTGREGEVLRRNLPAAAVLLLVVIAAVAVQVA